MTRPLAALAGAAAGVLQLAGGLKTAPGLPAAPVDLTLAAGLVLTPALALTVVTRRWTMAPALGVPLAAAGLLAFWLVVAAGWSASRVVAPAKLADILLVGVPMLVAGLLLGAEPSARRALVAASLCAGAALAVAVLHAAWTRDLLRVALEAGAMANYQVAGLAMAIAAGLAAVRAVEARGVLAAAAWIALVLLLGAAALLPGGRAALASLVLAATLAPALRLWLDGRVAPACGWLVAGVAAASGFALLVTTTDHAALRTVERLTTDAGSLQARVGLWQAALALAGDAMPLGLGTGAFSTAAGHGERRGLYPHNHALEALAEAGLPGLLFWLLAFAGGAVAFVLLSRGVAPARAARIAAMVLPVAVSAMVSSDLGNRMAWFALGLALSLGVTALPGRVTALPRHV